MSPDPEDQRPAGSARGLWLVALAALVILVGGGAAVWSLLRELRASPASLADGSPASVMPSPAATLAAGGAARAP